MFIEEVQPRHVQKCVQGTINTLLSSFKEMLQRLTTLLFLYKFTLNLLGYKQRIIFTKLRNVI